MSKGLHTFTANEPLRRMELYIVNDIAIVMSYMHRAVYRITILPKIRYQPLDIIGTEMHSHLRYLKRYFEGLGSTTDHRNLWKDDRGKQKMTATQSESPTAQLSIMNYIPVPCNSQLPFSQSITIELMITQELQVSISN